MELHFLQAVTRLFHVLFPPFAFGHQVVERQVFLTSTILALKTIPFENVFFGQNYAFVGHIHVTVQFNDGWHWITVIYRIDGLAFAGLQKLCLIQKYKQKGPF
jgi:hypothetical protein